MKLCKCGCGKEVISPTANYINGHNTKGLKRDPSSALKRKQTVLMKYGVDNINQLDEIKEKKKQTCIDHFGVESHNQSQKIKEKKKQTLLKNYGVDHQLKSKEVQEKVKNTCLIKFGVENPNQSSIIKEHKKKTCRFKYGVDFITQSKEIQEKSKLIMLNRYGVDNYSKTSDFRELARKNRINHIMLGYKDGSKFSPMKGLKEDHILDELQNYTKYEILKNQTFIGYFPDGYIKEINLIIEIYEPWHNHTYYLKHDEIRKNDLINHLKCNFCIIYLNQWLENKEQVISNFQKILNSEFKTQTCSSA